MAKLGSWGQAVRGQSQRKARTRKSTGSGGGFINDYKTEVGVKHRFVIPTFTDEDGNTGLFIQSRVVHQVRKWGAVAIKTSKGNEFKPYAVGTSHPYKQPSFEKSLEIAKRGDIDIFSKLATLTETDRWAKVNELDNDKDTAEGKQEFKDFNRDFDANHLFIEAASYKDKDGNWQDSMENYLLILQLETEMVEEERGSGVKRQVAKVVLDDNGFPKYEPKFWRVSAKRLGDIQKAVDFALDNNLIQDEDLFPYTEGAGTEDEVVTYTGWLEMEISYPHAEGRNAKMEAGREATISAINSNTSTITEEFVEDFQENKGKELFEKAVKDFDFSKSHLKAHSQVEQLEMLSAEARDYLSYLEETYPQEATRFDDSLKTYYENIISQSGGGTAEDTEEVEETTEEVEETPEVEETVEETPEVEEVEETEEVEDVNEESKSKLDDLLNGL